MKKPRKGSATKNKLVCYATYKKCFKTKAEAEKFIADKKIEEPDTTLVDSYQCDDCKNYHITSMSREKKERIEKKMKINQKSKEALKPKSIPDYIENRLKFLTKKK